MQIKEEEIKLIEINTINIENITQDTEEEKKGEDDKKVIVE